MGKLAAFYGRYESIIQTKDPSQNRDKALAELMTDMEREFSIPAIHNPKWEQKNRPVTALYRIISESRTTLG